MEELIKQLNSREKNLRMDALEKIAGYIDSKELVRTPNSEVNNHVHTFYSFSPYSPAGAAFAAWKSGLQAVGLMDHDSISGAEEMIEACKKLAIASTIGVELRVNFTGTAVEGRRTNNPDSKNISYITLQGIPFPRIGEVKEFLAPINNEREKRDRKETKKLNTVLSECGIREIDFDRDVAAFSMVREGGSITERHIVAAVARRLIEKFRKNEGLIHFLETAFVLTLPERTKEFLSDNENPHYLYDLVGALKGDFVNRFFIQPNERECLPVSDVIAFANSIGAIPAYSYLGDVGESPTGDKRAQVFEDPFLDELIKEVKEIGFKAITYMPPRNTRNQLDRIQRLCREYNFMEISGVDINSSRQVFNCPEILDERNRHLIDSTWALIAHEKLTGYNPNLSLFSNKNPAAALPLKERIMLYNGIGRALDKQKPENITMYAEKVKNYGC